MIAVLRQRNFALLFAGGLISAFGSAMLDLALPFYIYARTGSVLASGSMFIAQVLPVLALGSITGVFVDRWDRRLTMLVSDGLRAALILVLLLVQSPDWLWLVYVIAAAEAAISLFFGQADAALRPAIVAPEQLLAANSAESAAGNVIRLTAPLIGAGLLAILGLPILVLLDAASYLWSALMLVFVRVPRTDPSSVEANTANVLSPWLAFWTDWRDGLLGIVTDRVLVILLLSQSVAMLGQGALNVLLVPYVERVLNVGALEFGWIVSAQGIGGLLGALVIGRLGLFLPPRYLIVLGLTAAGAVLLVIGNVPTLLLVLVLFALLGAPVTGWLISLQTILQMRVAEDQRGRVFGAFGTTSTLCLVGGMAIVSALGETLAIPVLFDAAGLLFLAGGMVALLLPLGAPNPRRVEAAVPVA